MRKIPRLRLGTTMPLDGGGAAAACALPAHHLVTHGVVVGMTGSGKTGLVTVLAEEALSARVPVLMIDVKGDLPDLLLAFRSFSPNEFLPWVKSSLEPGDEREPLEVATALAQERERSLRAWGFDESDLAGFNDGSAIRVITPGSTAGESLHVLSSLERRSSRWDHDAEAARAALAASVSLVLRLLGRDPDPARSREHVLLSVFAEQRLKNGQSAEIPALLDDLARLPIDRIGALSVDSFLPKSERRALAAALNGLLASPSFESWRSGAPGRHRKLAHAPRWANAGRHRERGAPRRRGTRARARRAARRAPRLDALTLW